MAIRPHRPLSRWGRMFFHTLPYMDRQELHFFLKKEALYQMTFVCCERLLKKYKYPPEEAENALNVVLRQCEQWAEHVDDR